MTGAVLCISFSTYVFHSWMYARPYHATWERSRRLPFLLTDDPVQQFRVFFNRRGEVTAPFPPGPRVIPDLPVADQLQDDIEPGRAHAPRAIADHLVAGMEALLIEPRANLVQVLDRGIRVQKHIPGYAGGARDVARSRDAGDLLAGVLLQTPGIRDDGFRMRPLHEFFQFVLLDDHVGVHSDFERARFRRHDAMLVSAAFGRPFDPAAVQNLQSRVTEILQH